MEIVTNTQIRDYKIIKELGKGGMGSVYLADDLMLERKVALKMLDPLLTREKQFKERFKNEAKVQASLLHPNIVALHNFFEENGNLFMVMEYAEGITLKELIEKTGPIPEERAVKIFSQLLEGVNIAHKRGIIHRDIKPSNIIIDKNDNVKIMDFGIAKILGERGLTSTGTKIGTIYYMSPEQVMAAKDIDQRTDIYSLGITFFQMLTGKLPYNTDTDSDFAVMEEIVRGEIEDPRNIYPHIEDKIVKILFNMVEKEKEKRIDSCKEILNRLERSRDINEIVYHETGFDNEQEEKKGNNKEFSPNKFMSANEKSIVQSHNNDSYKPVKDGVDLNFSEHDNISIQSANYKFVLKFYIATAIGQFIFPLWIYIFNPDIFSPVNQFNSTTEVKSILILAFVLPVFFVSLFQSIALIEMIGFNIMWIVLSTVAAFIDSIFNLSLFDFTSWSDIWILYWLDYCPAIKIYFLLGFAQFIVLKKYLNMAFIWIFLIPIVLIIMQFITTSMMEALDYFFFDEIFVFIVNPISGLITGLITALIFEKLRKRNYVTN